MRLKSKKKKKYIWIIIVLISIIGTYKYLDSKNIYISNKEMVNLIVKSGFNEDNFISEVINYKKNPIKLLNQTYNESVMEDVSSKPIIYLYNSHPTEEYKSSDFLEYSIVPTVIMNNYIMEDIFNKKGYKTYVEEKSVKDILDSNHWNYASSYKASRILLDDAKSNNPSLKYFIDIHRDSLSRDKTTISIDDKSYAKIIFILGLENENYRENLTFIEKINNKIDEYYPGLSKGIYKKEGAFVNGVYNQDFSNRVILVEIGGYENTTTEVLNTSIAFSKCYLEVLDEENS